MLFPNSMMFSISMSKARGSDSPILPRWKIVEYKPRGFKSRPCGFEPWSSQTNDFKMYACRFLARHSTSLG